MAYRVPTFLVAIEIVAATDCVAVLPSHLVRAAATQLATLSMPIEVPGFSVLLGWHTSQTRLAPHVWLRERLIASASV